MMHRLPYLLAFAVLLLAPPAVAQQPRDPPAALRMMQQLQEEDWILRAEALHYLGAHRVASAAEAVGDVLHDESATPWLRGRSLLALAQIDPWSAAGDVEKFSRTGDQALRCAAAEAFEILTDDFDEAALTRMIDDESSAVRYRALASHAKRNGEAAWAKVEPATRSLAGEDVQFGCRALAFVGSDVALKRLAEVAANDRPKMPVIRGVLDIYDAALLPVKLKLLVQLQPDTDEFAMALTSLAKHDQGELVSAMQTALSAGDQQATRAMAITTTRLAVGPEIGDSLRKSLANVDNPETIKSALAALGPKVMQPDRHQELFTGYLDHQDVEIRALAIRCLAHCQQVNLFTVLEDRLKDPEPLVVHASLGVLLRAPIDTAPHGKLVAYLRPAFDSSDPATRDLAYEVLGHAGTEEDFQPALAALGDLLRGGDDARRAAAATALGKIAPPGGIEQLVRKQGYVSNWRIVGTFLNDRQNNGFHKTFPPDEKIDFTAKYKAKYVWELAGEGGNKGEIEREIEWTEASVDETDGRLIIPPLMPPPATLSVAFAVADFRSSEDREALLHVDGDDAFRVLLNGEQVAEQAAEYRHRHPCVASQQGIKIQLRQGKNRFIVKTTNIDFQWWVRLRLTDEAGYPVEVQTR